MAESLILSDGTRTYDFLAASAAIYVAPDGLNLPVVSRENTYAEGSDSEGRSRIRSRAVNSEAGSLTLYFRASTATTFWDAVDNLQELVESAHLNKGTLAYTKYGSTSSVTYDLESIQITGLPIKGTESAQRHTEATITFESKPYGRLASQRLNIQDTYQETVTALSPSIFLPLGASAGLTDLTANARNGTAVGSPTIGGLSGPLTVSDGGSTVLNGSSQYITTTYGTRRNVWPNPGFETNLTGVAGFNATIAQSSTQRYWGDQSCRLTATAAGSAIVADASAGAVAIAGITYTLSYYLYTTVSGRQGRADIAFYNAGGTIIGAATAGTAATASVGTWTRYSVTATAPALTAFVGFVIRGDASYTGSASEVCYIDAILIEAAGSVGSYFPTPDQLSSGEAGWSGTANGSPSAIGCFADGTTRTFMGWGRRSSSSTLDTLVGGNVTNPPVIQLAAGSQDVVLRPFNASPTSWTAAWPGNGQWVHWALIFDDAGNTASLYINGALVSTQACANGYNPYPDNLMFGAYNAGTDPADMAMAWVSVHQTALTATQILNAYDAGKAHKTLNGPIDSFVVKNVPGQVSALPVIRMDERSSKARNIVEVGVQYEYDPNNIEQLSLSLASGLTAQGGTSTTRSGSQSVNVCRATLTTTAVSVCKAASQTHKGLWKIRTRIYPSAATVLVRLAWRSGDGPFSREKWIAVPGSAAWFDLDLGTVNIKELPSGHTCEFRIEAKTSSGVPTVDVDIVECIPADCYTKLRGSTAIDTASAAIVAADDFSTQTAGAVTGKTPLYAPAGLWSGAGDADDFQVITSPNRIYRTALSDSADNNGRYLRCGSGTLTTTTIQCDWNRTDTGISGETFRQGVFLRYTDTSNFLFAGYITLGAMMVLKRVAGTETVLALALGDFRGNRTIQSSADASGNVVVYESFKGGVLVPMMTVVADSSLATAGALASGGYGIYDAETAANPVFRYYDNFSVSTLATSATIVNPAINSGYGLDLKHNTALTDNSTGTSTGTTPIRQGNYPKLPPATRNGTKSRIVVRARRDDNDLGLADSGTSDVLRATLTVTPRVHLTGT